jgi:galactonate dehydratase
VAHRAEQRGFKALKCAPFDECSAPYPTSRAGVPECAAAGLARIRAIHDAVGPEVAVYVDCHRRFDLAASLALAAALDDTGVTWFEEALDPLVNRAEMRQITAATAMTVAGGELGYGRTAFARILNEAAADVIMPDVMFCGGPAEAYRMGVELEATHPDSVSLHCPAGPIALLASAHATAAIGGSRPLEHAVDEVPWRHELLEVEEQVADSSIQIPLGSGLGTRVDRGFVERRGGRCWAE